jgi:hypothetical protein
MRLQILLSLALLAACSSSGANPRPEATPAPTQTVRVSGAATMGQGKASSLRVTGTDDLAADTIAVPLDSIWRILPHVYSALGLEGNLMDPQERLFGNSGIKLYRRLGQTPLRRLLDCGSTQLGPNADSYEIVFASTTRLTRVDAANTIVTTMVQASGRPMQFNSGEASCRTKGELEKQIALLIRTRVLPP